MDGVKRAYFKGIKRGGHEAKKLICRTIYFTLIIAEQVGTGYTSYRQQLCVSIE
jgi:hypothetical protein